MSSGHPISSYLVERSMIERPVSVVMMGFMLRVEACLASYTLPTVKVVKLVFVMRIQKGLFIYILQKYIIRAVKIERDISIG
jgi:hypothetical protein